MASRYPSGFDTDVQIPRIDSNITEIGPDAINGLRDAVFTIEKILGLNVHGSATDLVTRLNQSLDANGNLKVSAIATLWSGSPITNAHIANNAAIEEVKLDLDFGTTQLKTWIDTLRVRVNTMYRQMIIDIGNLAQHTGYPSSYGRHRTSDIDGYTTPETPWTSSNNLQGILHSLYDGITDHIADPTGAHEASAISVDDTNFIGATGDDVQKALESLDLLEITELTKHRDRQHSNGILNTQETFYNNTKFSIEIVASSALETAAVGLKYVEFTASPSNFAIIQRDDSIVITQGSNSYIYKIDRIESLAKDTVFLQGFLPISLTTATAKVYRSTEETSSPSVLKNTIKERVGSPRTSVFAIHPNAPYVVGNGINPGLIANGSVENIRFEWYSNYYGSYQFDLESKLPATAYDRTPQIIVDACNLELTTNYIPIVAFLHENEIGFALDEGLADGYLTIATPTPAPANSAWAALGISEGVTWFSRSDRNSYVDGYESASFTKIIDTTAALAGTIITFTGVDPEALGVARGHLVRVINGTDDGTYMVNSVTNTTIQVLMGGFVGSSGTIIVYNDTFYDSPIKRTLYETFVDLDKDTRELSFDGVPRVRYNDAAIILQTMEDKLNILSVSRNFTASTMRIIFNDTTDILQLGEPSGAGLLAGTEGPSVVVPATSIGKIFKLYDATRTAYIEVQMISNALVGGGNTALDCYIEDRISEEFHLQTGTALFTLSPTTKFINLTDNRLFGNVGRQDIRTDFKRDYISYPMSKIRANGVIYGFLAGGSGTTVTLSGGEVLVNGSIKNVDSKSIAIPTDASTVSILYNIFVDEDGEFNFLINNRDLVGYLTPSLEEIIMSEDKVIIAQVTTLNGSYVSVADYRRFVNNLDNKIELIVENNDISHGSFASIGAAANWINAISATTGFPIPRTIRVRGSITYDASILGATTLPDGVSLVGDGSGYNSTYGSRIYVTNNTTGTSVIIPQDNCIIKDIAFEAAASSTDMSDGFIGGDAVSVGNIIIDNCSFTHVSPAVTTDFYGIRFDTFYNLRISECYFANNSVAIKNKTSGAVGFIKDCNFINCFDYGIFLTGLISFNISGNNMLFHTMNTTVDAIRVNSGINVVIEKNSITSTNTSTAANDKIMIVVDYISVFTKIIDNVLINNSTIDTAFGRGIVLGTSGVVFPTPNHTFATISGNNIQHIYGLHDQVPIHILATYYGLVSNNITTNCRGGVNIDDLINPCSYITITGNYFDNVGTGLAAIKTNNVLSSFFVVSNNAINFIDPTPTGRAVYLVGFLDLVFTNNRINVVNDTQYANTEISITNSVITGNTFTGGGNFTDITQPPLVVNGNNCNITGNTFQIAGTILASGGAILINGTGCVDELNKGAYYRVVVPAGYRTISRSASGASSWEEFPEGLRGDNTFYASGTYVRAIFWFDRSIVPVGAAIQSVEILYTVWPGTVADLEVGWSKKTGLTSTYTPIRAMLPVSAAPAILQVELLNPGVESMNEQDVHAVIVELTNDSSPTSWEIIIYDIRVNYIL